MRQRGEVPQAPGPARRPQRRTKGVWSNDTNDGGRQRKPVCGLFQCGKCDKKGSNDTCLYNLDKAHPCIRCNSTERAADQCHLLDPGRNKDENTNVIEAKARRAEDHSQGHQACEARRVASASAAAVSHGALASKWCDCICPKVRNEGFLPCVLAAGRRWNWCVTVKNIDLNDLADQLISEAKESGITDCGRKNERIALPTFIDLVFGRYREELLPLHRHGHHCASVALLEADHLDRQRMSPHSQRCFGYSATRHSAALKDFCWQRGFREGAQVRHRKALSASCEVAEWRQVRSFVAIRGDNITMLTMFALFFLIEGSTPASTRNCGRFCDCPGAVPAEDRVCHTAAAHLDGVFK